MLRRYWLVLSLCVAVLLTGCARGTQPTPAADRPTVVVAGSGAYLALLRVLVDAYPQRDSVRFVFLDETHSSGGVRGVLAGDFDVAGVSRVLSASEQTSTIEHHVLSQDAMVIAVHPSVTIPGITRGQLRSVYAGRITNWKQLGGPDLPVVVLDRNEEESAKVAFRRFILGDTQVTSATSPLLFEDDTLKGVATTPGAIGYLSLGLALSRRAPVGILALDGVAPSVDAVETGTYRVVRPLGFVVRRDAAGPTRAFVRWAVGADAAEMLREKGYAAATPAP